MLQQEICKELTRHQIDFDLLPQDTLCRDAFVKNGQLHVHEETYGALIVPYSQYLPVNLLERMTQIAEEGVQVWFVDGFPEDVSGQYPVKKMQSVCKAVPFEKLAESIKKNVFCAIKPAEDVPSLRYFHAKRDDYDIFMLWNEDIFMDIDTEVKFPVSGKAVLYDAWNNRISAVGQENNTLRIHLEPSEATILCFGEWEGMVPACNYLDGQRQELRLEWKVSLQPVGKVEFIDYPLFELKNLAHELPDFCGTIRYEAVWNAEEPESYRGLWLTGVGEIAQLWLNGWDCGTVVGRPYRFEIIDKVKFGENHIRIEVISNPAYRERDEFSTYLPLPPMGLYGSVYVDYI